MLKILSKYYVFYLIHILSICYISLMLNVDLCVNFINLMMNKKYVIEKLFVKK